MLPTSRDLTINPGDEIPGALLNKLQDCVVGPKHPELERNLGAAAFGGGAASSFSVGQLNYSGASLDTCPLSLPVGDRITTITWGYIVGAGNTVTMRLMRRKTDGTAGQEAIAPTAGTTTDNTGATFETNVVTYNHIITTGYAYWLQFEVTNNAGNLFGATVKHDNL
jgi:hypothetical protein